MPTNVKICGITNLDDARVALDAGAWAIGLNFFPGSVRYIEPAKAGGIRAALPADANIVGVFVNQDRDTVASIQREVGLSLLQFHGDEPPAFCTGWSVPTIKAIRIRDRTSVASARGYAVDFILADAYVEGAYGGTGQRFDPNILQDLDRSRLILAGGLGPDNVAEAIRMLRPAAVDVASGVERAPGLKDHQLIRRFIANAHAA